MLSGYSTSAQGELLVAAFTGGMLDPSFDLMETHVLPTILIYHLGIDINKGLNAGDAARMRPTRRGATTSTATSTSGSTPRSCGRRGTAAGR